MAGTASQSPLRVVHVSLSVDPQKRDGEALLRAWRTLGDVPKAVAEAGVDVTVVQASHRRETVYRSGVVFQFVDEPRVAPVRLPLGGRWQRKPANVLQAVADARPTVIHLNGFH